MLIMIYLTKRQVTAGFCSALTRRWYSNSTNNNFNVTSSTHNNTTLLYALLIGGGYKDMPERNNYLSMQRLNTYLQQQPQTNISIYFGPGHKLTHITLSESSLLWSVFASRVLDTPLEENVTIIPNTQGAADLATISLGFTLLAGQIKAGNRLLIMLNGHGHPTKGITLRSSLHAEYLSTSYLQEQLAKLPSGVLVDLIVSSCYSAQFLNLSAKNITVFTSTFKPDVTKILLTEGTNLADVAWCSPHHYREFALSRTTDEPGGDSLCYFLDQQLKELSHRENLQPVKQQLIRYTNFFTLPNLTYLSIISWQCILYTAILNWHTFAVPAPSVWAMSTLFCYSTKLMSKQAVKIISIWEQRQILAQYKALENGRAGLPATDWSALPPTERAQLSAILKVLFQIHFEIYPEKKDYYYYLYPKAKIFLHLASVDQIRQFLAIATQALRLSRG